MNGEWLIDWRLCTKVSDQNLSGHIEWMIEIELIIIVEEGGNIFCLFLLICLFLTTSHLVLYFHNFAYLSRSTMLDIYACIEIIALLWLNTSPVYDPILK